MEKISEAVSIKLKKKLTFDDGVNCVKISPNGIFLAVALMDSKVKIFFVENFKVSS